MDYLHGDVVGDEFKAACQYESARESYVLRRATQLSRSKPTADIGHVAAFPEKGWNQLSPAERTELLCGLPLSTTTAQPLFLGEVIFLTPCLDQLKEMADKARAEWKEALAAGRPRRKIYPIWN
jgi:hypothetical protein